MNLQQHPLSAAWPAMSEADFIGLKDSIESIGVQMPIVIFEGQVIDGWNRYRAATDLGMNCPTVPFNEEIDPVDFVKAMNDARRHITASQRAIAIVSIRAWKPVGKPKANVEPGSTLSQEAMAAEAGVSKKTIQQAQTAQKAGLADKVKSGEMSVKQAAQAAKEKSAKPAQKKGNTGTKAKPAEPAPETSGTELQQAADTINQLAAENERLTDRLAVEAMDASEEEKTAAAEIIADLRHQVMTLTAELDAMRISRDSFQAENSELMKQVVRNQRELKKLKEGA